MMASRKDPAFQQILFFFSVDIHFQFHLDNPSYTLFCLKFPTGSAGLRAI